MKARILFYCFAVVALVLILAAVPSHATERRDPPIVQDATQAQASSAATHATVSGKKHAPRSAQKGVNSAAQPKSKAKTSSTISSPNGSGEHEGPGSSSAK